MEVEVSDEKYIGATGGIDVIDPAVKLEIGANANLKNN